MASEVRSALERALSDLTEAVQVLLGTGTEPASCRLVDELLGRSAPGRVRTPSPRRRRPARRHLALVR